MPDTSKLGKLNRELEKSEKKLRKAINDEKALQHQLKQLTRKERTHRLCTRGGIGVRHMLWGSLCGHVGRRCGCGRCCAFGHDC